MRHIAQRQAKAGQAEKARTWIGEEADPLVKAYALLGLAEGLVRDK
jgi:hypothetical protein